MIGNDYYFTGQVVPSTPSAPPTYVNPYFSVTPISGSEYYSPLYGNYNIQNDPTAEMKVVPLTMQGSVVTNPYVPKSVGLEMGNLEEQMTEEHYTDANVSFNNLVLPTDNRNITEKFGVQPIPVDMDRSMLPKPIAYGQFNASDLSHNINKDQTSKSSGRRVTNWFSRLLEQRGDDYITSGKLTIDEVSKNAERILDDMISGRIDYSKYGQYIVMPIIIETLINYCSNKLAINKAIQLSLGYMYNDYTNMACITNDTDRVNTLMAIDDAQSRNIAQAIAIVNQDIDIYNMLYSKLIYVNNTKNASSLFSLVNDLNNFKKQVKKRY